jgi:PadR family transcriptional regulator, regulatory protein PadR
MRMTRPLERLLTTLLSNPSAHWYGYELMKTTKLTSGTLYPMLARLQERGMVTSEWEPAPTVAGRPPRKYYQLTGEGARVARELSQSPRTTSLQPVGGPGPAESS